eukprot:jgi/Mesvir1/11574/Mv04336-RA.1
MPRVYCGYKDDVPRGKTRDDQRPRTGKTAEDSIVLSDTDKDDRVPKDYDTCERERDPVVLPLPEVDIPRGTGVYEPYRMEGVDATYEYNDPELDAAMGDRIAHIRATDGDGNCFYYAVALGRACLGGVKKRASDKAIAERVKVMKDRLSGLTWADAKVAMLLAFHIKEDIVGIRAIRVVGSDAYKLKHEMYKGNGYQGERSGKPPLYVLNQSQTHFYSAIPQSYARDAPPDTELEAMKGERSSPIKRSVERLEEHMNVTNTEKDVAGALDEARELKDATNALADMKDNVLTLEQMSNDEFRQAIEKEVLEYEGTDAPMNTVPVRPVENVEPTNGANKKANVGRPKISHPALTRRDAEESARQFLKSNPTLDRGYSWVPPDSLPVEVRYIKTPGGIKVQAKFSRDGPFINWLLVARSRFLDGRGIRALGLYADQVLPAGKVVGLYTGRVIGPHLSKTEMNSNKRGVYLTRLRLAIADATDRNDKMLIQTYHITDESIETPLLVDGSRGASSSSGITYDPDGVGVLFPWTYLHASNDPRWIGGQRFPNAYFPDNSAGLKTLNTVYPMEEILWYYDDDQIDDRGNVKPGPKSKGNGYLPRLLMFQKAAMGKITQDELRDFMASIQNAALDIVAEVMEDINAHNKKTKNERRFVRLDDDDEADFSLLLNSGRYDHLDSDKLASVRSAYERYSTWKSGQ